ncbi:hypothetical protein HDZ31DRAFT_20084, partial [Schizophyllum fasciatum]
MGDIRRQTHVRRRQAVANHCRDESGSTGPYAAEAYSSSTQVSVSSAAAYASGTRSPRSHAWSTNAHAPHSQRLPPRMGLPPAFHHPKPHWPGQNLIPPDELLSPSYAGRRPSLPNIPLSPPPPAAKATPNRAASNPATLATIPLTPTPLSGPGPSSSSSSTRTPANGAPLPRRASSAGILGFNGLRKKPSMDQDGRDRDVREREHDQKQRAQRRLEKEKEKDARGAKLGKDGHAKERGHRKKLSISSSAAQQQQQQQQAGSSRTRTRLRRATSGSNLREVTGAREPVVMREGVVREDMAREAIAREADAASQASSKKSEGSSTKK